MQFQIIIEEINRKIRNFNEFLQRECHFPEIDTSNKNIYSSTLQRQWGGENWANKDSYGVYILFGVSEKNPNEVGLYIGKASQQYIGYRLWSHFKPHKETLNYHKMRGDDKVTFHALCTISTTDHSCRSLASSLEEYLISGGFESAFLVNKVGRK